MKEFLVCNSFHLSQNFLFYLDGMAMPIMLINNLIEDFTDPCSNASFTAVNSLTELPGFDNRLLNYTFMWKGENHYYNEYIKNFIVNRSSHL